MDLRDILFSLDLVEISNEYIQYYPQLYADLQNK